VPLADILPFANPGLSTNIACCRNLRPLTIKIIAAGVIDDLTGLSSTRKSSPIGLKTSRAVGDPRRLMACTDCAFDTSAGMGRVTEDVVWAKLDGRRRRYRPQRLF
jgi:5-methyltetrahydropteroyltriglutamate--homocysteine methyltransferase